MSSGLAVIFGSCVNTHTPTDTSLWLSLLEEENKTCMFGSDRASAAVFDKHPGFSSHRCTSDLGK